MNSDHSRYQRQIGRIGGRSSQHTVLTDTQTAALRAFYIGVAIAKRIQERRYPTPVVAPRHAPPNYDSWDDMGTGFAVGNTNPSARGMHLGSLHPDRGD